MIKSEVGTHPRAVAEDGVDVYALTHNETSTGVAMPISAGAAPTTRWCSSTPPPARAACPVDVSETDVYYFAPQKSFASDGGLWIALMSPARPGQGRARSPRPAATCPSSSACRSAIDNSRKDQTYNTPAVATLFLLADQLDWMNGNGGLAWTTARTADSAQRLYTLGREELLRHAVRRRPELSARRWSARSTSPTRSTPPRSPRCCAPTASSTPSPTASSAATSCASRCSRPSTRPTSRR